jgi:hydrogenase nickel incorporation protein HypA/HybF
MHELSLAQGIIDIVHRSLPPENSQMVSVVRLKIGDLAGVVIESLEFCFTALVRETLLDGAILQIDRVPVQAVCLTCSSTFTVNEDLYRCPQCGAGQLDIISGRELQVTEIELHESHTETS